MKKSVKWILLGGIIAIIAVVLVFTGKAEESSFGLARPSEHFLFNAQVDNRVSISWDAGTDEILTDSAHGLVVGDVIRFETASAQIDDTTFAEGTNYYVVTASATQAFEVSTTKGGTAVNIGATASDSGGTFFQESMDAVINVDGAELITFTIVGEEVPSAAVKFAGSINATKPDFLASQSASNMYEYLDVVDAQDAASIDGDTGIANPAGTDLERMFYVDDARALNWFAVILEEFASGSWTVQVDTR